MGFFSDWVCFLQGACVTIRTSLQSFKKYLVAEQLAFFKGLNSNTRFFKDLNYKWYNIAQIPTFVTGFCLFSGKQTKSLIDF